MVEPSEGHTVYAYSTFPVPENFYFSTKQGHVANFVFGGHRLRPQPRDRMLCLWFVIVLLVFPGRFQDST